MQFTIHVNVVLPILVLTLIVTGFSLWQLQKVGIAWIQTRDKVMLLVAIFLLMTLADEFWSLALQLLDVFFNRDIYLEPMRWARFVERVFAVGCLMAMHSIYVSIRRDG